MSSIKFSFKIIWLRLFSLKMGLKMGRTGAEPVKRQMEDDRPTNYKCMMMMMMMCNDLMCT